MSEPVAIIGIGCRFPGGADAADTYWNLLRTGVDAITEVPSDRWDPEVLSSRPDIGKMHALAPSCRRRVRCAVLSAFHRGKRRRWIRSSGCCSKSRGSVGIGGQPSVRWPEPDRRDLGISTNDYAAVRESSLVDIDLPGTANAFSVAAGRLSFVGLQANVV